VSVLNNMILCMIVSTNSGMSRCV